MGSLLIGCGPWRQMTADLAGCSPRFMEQGTSSAEHKAWHLCANYGSGPCSTSLLIQRMVLRESVPALPADCDTFQIHYLCANMI